MPFGLERLSIQVVAGRTTVESQAPYEEYDHTADVLIVVRGRNLPILFSRAAQALTDQMVRAESVSARKSRQVVVEALGPEALLHAWLEELLYVFSTEGFLGREFEIRRFDGNRLEAVVRGEPLDLDRHERGKEVKAITWHRFTLARDGEGWRAELVLDV